MLAAVFALIGSLGGVVLGQWLAGRNLKRQLEHDAATREGDRHHELELRRLELREEHRARLQQERLAAYTAFSSAHLHRKWADEQSRIWWGHRQFRGSQDPIDPTAFDAANQRAIDEMAAAAEGRREVEKAVAVVTLVASRPVREAAAKVLEAAAAASKAQLQVSAKWERGGLPSAAPDEVVAALDAAKHLTEAETVLSDRISSELELDR